MEIINNFLNYEQFKIYQRNDGFCFSLDSVLLANFATVNKKVLNVVDLGCGNAPIPLILSTRTDAKIIGVELQQDIYNLARKTIAINKLDEQVTILNDNLHQIHLKIGQEKYDLVTCNPPYFKVSSNSNLNTSVLKEIARHEIFTSFDQICYNARALLKNNGYFAIVHRVERFMELIKTLEVNKLVVKRIRFVYPKQASKANLVLIETRKSGNLGVSLEAPLIVHNDDGSYSNEVLQMFGGYDEYSK